MEYSGSDSHRIDHDGGAVRVVQLTDTHLCRQRGGTLLGMDTDHSLQAVIDQVQAERPGTQLLLGTGDLSDGGAREAYERLQAYFEQFSCPGFWLPGNHDDLPAMLSVAGGPERLCRELRIGCWQVLLLDSHVPGEVGGRMGEAELTWLQAALADSADKNLHSLVCLHHQPVAIGCEWLDEQMVADADALFAILDRHPCVKGVVWGHVHQRIDRRRNGVSLMASPSTCVQFAPGSASFKADDLPPGYRWLDLYPDGRIDTGVSRVEDVAFTVELDSSGYL